MDDLSDRQLARLIRSSPVLDAQLKAYWLRVLPHLSDAERVRLLGTLRSAQRDLQGES
ncbi:MAG TPA: hypothetical protein VHL09_00030 [Dehalococcoidia bacterium]|nr:hypothetical protein [Dehalococcoidia bacterium]